MTDCRFTLAEYRAYLEQAREAGYRFVDFESDGDGGAQILLRHDVDYAPAFMPPTAGIETAVGARATYCVQVDSPWYAIDTAENRAAIEQTLAGGHWLGLHFDATMIESDDRACELVAAQAADLGAAFASEVRVVSFHMPGRRPVGHLELPGGLVNTYAPRFFGEIGYVSDSNQNWRGVDLSRVLTERAHERLQLLIHPFWWRSEPGTMRGKLEELAGRLGVDPSEIITPEQLELIAREDAVE